jgi:hypothetical protein
MKSIIVLGLFLAVSSQPAIAQSDYIEETPQIFESSPQEPVESLPVGEDSALVPEPTDQEIIVEPLDSRSELSQDSSAQEAGAEATTETSKEEENQAPENESSPTSIADNRISVAAISEDEGKYQRLYGRKLFGTNRVQLGINRPNFTEVEDNYKKIYGNPTDYLTLSGDWFPLDWWVNPGMTMKVGGYSVSGTPLSASSVGTPAKGTKSRLLFLPLMVGGKIQATPFRRKWIVLEGWVGYESLWWQETKEPVAALGASNRRLIAEEVDSEDKSVLTSKGRMSAMVMGGALNLQLNWLDESTVRSMISTMGVSYVYLTPYFEIVRSFSTKGLTFGRNVIGLGFTFETFK